MTGFAFVNLSHPHELRNHHVQTEIRRHVMGNIGRSRRKRPRARVVSLEFRKQRTDINTRGTQDSMSELPGLEPQYSLCPSGILGMELDERALQIVQFMINGSGSKHRPFRVVWIRIGLSDSTAFQLSLASAVQARYRMCGSSSDHADSARYYFKALEQLSKRLSDREEWLTPGVIATVLGCLCHDTLVGNWERWTVHSAGLVRMFKLRGGFDEIECHIPLMAFWLDLVGCTVFDLVPRLPIPRDVVTEERPEETPKQRVLLSNLESDFNRLSPLYQGFRLTFWAAEKVNNNEERDDFWKDEVGAIELLGPATHFLLSASISSGTFSTCPSTSVIGELVRLTCLMLLSGLKARFALNALDLEPIQTRFENVAVQLSSDICGGLYSLALWALVTSALLHSSEKRAYLIPIIHDLSWNHGFFHPQDTLYFARNSLWINALETAEELNLIQEMDKFAHEHPVLS